MLETLNYASNFGYLTIGSVYMHRKAFCVVETELLKLWSYSKVRGSNVPIFGASGTRPYGRRIDEATVSLTMVFCGTVDKDGNPTSNVFAGLKGNVDYVLDNVLLPTDGSVATRSASLVIPGQTLTADVQPTGLVVEALDPSMGDTVMATLDLTIPSGLFQ